MYNTDTEKDQVDDRRKTQNIYNILIGVIQN